MLSDEFIKTEMLAGDYIGSIITVKNLLAEGETEKCLNMLNELELAMKVALALGERYDLDIVN